MYCKHRPTNYHNPVNISRATIEELGIIEEFWLLDTSELHWTYTYECVYLCASIFHLGYFTFCVSDKLNYENIKLRNIIASIGYKIQICETEMNQMLPLLYRLIQNIPPPCKRAYAVRSVKFVHYAKFYYNTVNNQHIFNKSWLILY